jgi:hypothetical protein
MLIIFDDIFLSVLHSLDLADQTLILFDFELQISHS